MIKRSIQRLFISCFIFIVCVILIILVFVLEELFLSAVNMTSAFLIAKASLLCICILIILYTSIRTLKQFASIHETNDLILTHLEDAVLISDANNTIIFVNKSFEKMSGYEEKELIGKKPSILKSGQHNQAFYQNIWGQIDRHGYWEGEVIDKRKDGQLFVKKMKVFVVRNKNHEIIRHISIQSNIDQIKKLEYENHVFQYYSDFSSMANERSLKKDFDNLILTENSEATLLYCKVLNQVNIEAKVGQEGYVYTLLQLGQIIKDEFRYKKVSVYELNHNTLCIMISGENIDYEVAIDRIIRTSRHLLFNQTELSLSVKFGVSIYPKDGNDLNQLITKSRVALKSIMDNPAMSWVASEHIAQDTIKRELEIQTALSKALLNQELEVHYQPQMNAETKKVIGLEALIRWRSKDYGFVSPNVFIPIAEKYGYMKDLERFVFNQVFSDYQKISRINKNIHISINASLYAVISDYIYQLLTEMLEKYPVITHQVIIELTESQTTTHVGRLSVACAKIKALGFRLSLDDFGTGYNALSVLFDIPFDEIKIDRSFMKKEMSKKDESIVKAVVSLGNSIGLRVVAEGVETNQQEDFLLKHDCQIMQGYFYSGPLPIEAALDFIKNNA